MKKQQPIHGALRARTRAFLCALALLSFTTARADYTVTTQVLPAEAAAAGCTVSGAGTYSGSVSFTATPASGWVFAQWRPSNNNQGYNDARNPKAASSYGEDFTMTAFFVPVGTPTYTITQQVNDASLGRVTPATIDLGGSVGTNIYEGSIVCLYTDNFPYGMMGDGTYFVRWSDGYTVYSTEQAPIIQSVHLVTVTGNADYTAYWSDTPAPATPTYTITWVDGNGDEIYHETVTEGDVPAFDDRTTPTKTQTAQYTYTFNNTWSPTPYAANNDQTYTAQFNQTTRQYTITVTSAGHGTVTGGGTYDYGTSVPLTATPDTYYSFSSWTDAGAQNHNVTVTGTASYTASFTLNTSSTLDINDNENTTYYSTILAAYNGTPMDIRIRRKFFAGMWNTVCFPFDLTAAQRSSSDMSAATFYTLSSVTGDAAEGLDFNVTAITTETMTARTPYLVQFTGADINNPTFTGVTLAANAFTNNTTGQSVGETKFFGTVHPTDLAIGENSGFLFLGQNNTIYWPNSANKIRAFRAYFYSSNNAVQAIHPRVRIVLQNETTTDLSDKSEQSAPSVKKYMENGSLVIEKNGVKYNAVGQQIK